MCRTHLRQGATLFEHLGAEVLAAWGYHYTYLTLTEGTMQKTDDCVWQVDDLQLSVSFIDMRQFRVHGPTRDLRNECQI